MKAAELMENQFCKYGRIKIPKGPRPDNLGQIVLSPEEYSMRVTQINNVKVGARIS